MSLIQNAKREFYNTPLNSMGVLAAFLAIAVQLQDVFFSIPGETLGAFSETAPTNGEIAKENMIRWLIMSSALSYLLSFPCAKVGESKPFSGFFLSILFSIFYVFVSAYIAADLLVIPDKVLADNTSHLYFGLSDSGIGCIAATFWFLLLSISFFPNFARWYEDDPSGENVIGGFFLGLFGLIGMLIFIINVFPVIFNGLAG